MQGGFRAYWWRVIVRSTKDAGNVSKDLGIAPTRLLIAFVLVLLACTAGSLFLGESVCDRILWALGTLAAGLGLFFLVLMFFVVQTPWRFENESTTKHAGEIERLQIGIDELTESLKRKQSIQDTVEEGDKLIGEGNKLAMAIKDVPALAGTVLPSNDERFSEHTQNVATWIDNGLAFVTSHFPGRENYFMSDAGLVEKKAVGMNIVQHRLFQQVHGRLQRLHELLANVESWRSS